MLTVPIAQRNKLGPLLKTSLVLGLFVGLSACTSLPESEVQCGTVSGFLTPDRDQDYYRAIVTHIQGKAVASLPNYQLAPGVYEFRFAELIHDPQLKVALSARQTKVLTVKVAANQRYHFAAKFKGGKLYYGEDSDYWQPEIWQHDSFECVILPKKELNKS